MIMNHIKKILYKIKNKEYFMKMTQKHLSCLASYTQGFSLKHACLQYLNWQRMTIVMTEF